MASPVVPSLSDSGWITETAEKADQLLANFFLTEASQSFLYEDQLSSLPALIQQYGGTYRELEQETTRVLLRYFSRYFQNVEAQAVLKIPDSAVDNRTQLTVHVSFVDQGVNYSLGRTVSIVDSKIDKVLQINN